MKKSVKILSVVLAVLVMTSALPLSVFAGIFTPIVPVCTEHTGGAADCQHKAICENCGTEYGDLGTHKYSSSTDPTCNVCGEERTIVESPTIKLHSYDNACDTTCNKCGEERTAPHKVGVRATCITPATCELCGASFGDVNPKNHTGNTDIRDYKAPSCNEQGFSGNEHCSDCGEIVKAGSVIQPTGDHVDSDDEWNFDENQHFHLCGCGTAFDQGAHEGGTATCTEKAKCTVCGAEYGNLLDHVYDNPCDTDCNECGGIREVEGHSGGQATCKEQALCEKCGAPYGDLLPHTYDNACDTDCNECGDIREVEDHTGGTATCTQKAICSECGEEYGELLPHTYDNPCDTDCNACGDIREVEGHSGGQATCKEQALCEKCGAPYGDLLDHTYDNACDADCNACGEERTPSDHVYDNGCDAECNVCGDIRQVEDHFGGTATCTQKAICSECGSEYGEKLDHTYSGVDDTDCDVCGEVRNLLESPLICLHRYDNENDPICNLCGDVREVETDENLYFKSAALVLESNLTVKYRVDKTRLDALGYTDPYVIFTFLGDESEAVLPTVENKDGNEYYVFLFTDVAANMLGDNISAVLYATNGDTLLSGKAQDYSAATYCYNKLADANTESDLRTLVIDLLNYGAQAQLYTQYKTDALANSSLTDEEKVIGDPNELNDSTTYWEKDMNEFMWNSASLILDNAVTVRVKFTAASVEGLVIKIKSSNAEWTFEQDQFVATGTGSYYLYFDGLNADQMREVLTFSAYQDGEEPIATLQYSIESYAHSKQESTIDYLADLVKAMMKYGDSVSTWWSARS